MKQSQAHLKNLLLHVHLGARDPDSGGYLANEDQVGKIAHTIISADWNVWDESLLVLSNRPMPQDMPEPTVDQMLSLISLIHAASVQRQIGPLRASIVLSIARSVLDGGWRYKPPV